MDDDPYSQKSDIARIDEIVSFWSHSSSGNSYISNLINQINAMNYFALIVAALVPMIMGMIFYHPKVMGNAWMKANGFTMEHVKANMPKPTMYLLTLVTSFLLASFFWAWVTGAGEADGPQTTGPEGQNYVTFQHGLAHGLIFGITVLLPIFTSMAIFEMRSRNWAIVNILYWTLTAMVMCGILSAWR